MANRKTNIHIQQRYGETFEAYSDFTIQELESIEGVVGVSDLNLETLGHLLFTIDKRYDSSEVIDEIKKRHSICHE